MVHLFSSLEYAQFGVPGGTCVSPVTSPCHSVGFCIAHGVISPLNSLAIQNEACISTAKYEHSTFFQKLC